VAQRILRAIALIAPSVTIAPLAARSAAIGTVQEPAPGPDSCGDGRPYQGVYCSENHNPGGPTGCFLSQCEAHRVGAYHCFKIDSCE